MPAYLTRLQCGAGRTQCTGQSAIGLACVSMATTLTRGLLWWKQAWLGPWVSAASIMKHHGLQS